MDPLSLQQRCTALHSLLTSDAAAPRSAVRPTPTTPHALLTQSTPLTSDQCAILMDWIAAVTVAAQQSVAPASGLPSAAVSASAASLPSCAVATHVVRLFRPLLSSLLARICSDAAHTRSISAFLHAADLLAHIAAICPHVLPTVAAWMRSAPFSLMDCIGAAAQSSSSSASSSSASTAASSSSSDLTVSFTVLRLLHLDALTFCALWDASPVMRLLSSPSALVRWCAANSAAIMLHMNEHDKTQFIEQTLQPLSASIAGVDSPAQVWQHYLASIQMEQSLVWVAGKENDAQNMLPAPTAAAGTVTDAIDVDAAASSSAQPASATAMDQQLSNHMVSLGGILLPRRTTPTSTSSSATPAPSSSSSLVHVSSTASHLRSIALALCERRPVLLEGPSGSGKTVLIEECARMLGQYEDMVRLHLDDQMDSKTLLGTYTCTDIPGEFKWQAGALTQAVLAGRWVLIEDVDRCPFEILSAIISLLERRELFMPGRGETIYAKEGFQIFATKTVASAQAATVTESTPLLHALFSRIYVQPLTYPELCVILSKKLTRCSKKLLQQILTTFQAFVALPNSASSATTAGAAPVAPALASALLGSSRKYSTRDLLKWVVRIERVLGGWEGNVEHLTSAVIEQIFLAALDVFVAPIPPPLRPLTAATAGADAVAAAVSAAASSSSAVPARGSLTPRQQVIAHIASLWGIVPERVHYLTALHKPELRETPSELKLGRVTLARRGTAAARNANAALLSNFAHTKYSLNMMEQMCMCVMLSEPVLLVSDTGVGKCWGRGTQMLMFDGSVRRVEDIEEGEALMGDDSTPRIVRPGSITRGNTAHDAAAVAALQPPAAAAPVPATYRVTSSNKQHAVWTCNGDHILVLRITQQPMVEQIASSAYAVTMWQLREHKQADGSVVAAPCKIALQPVFSCRRQAESLLASWTAAHGKASPLEWEATVNEFMQYAQETRDVCRMFKPQRIQFPKTDRATPASLQSRFAAEQLNQLALSADQCCHAFTIERVSHADYFGFTLMSADGGQCNGRLLFADFTVTHNTTTIQYLASLLGKTLHVQNLNQQSDSADLIGGFKPMEVSKLIVPLMNSFGSLFPRTFSRAQNADFLAKLREKFEQKKWNMVVKMMQQSVESAEKKLRAAATTPAGTPTKALAPATPAVADDEATPRKQAKTAAAAGGSSLLDQWSAFSSQLVHFAHQLHQISSSFVFHFHEGSLVTAIRNGDWILLDELNLASSETLERLSGILEGEGASLSVTERGDSAALVRHPDFRLFAAMNPSGDAGKKNLPPSIRARFTEVYIEEMTDREDLAVIIKQYLTPKHNPNAAVASNTLVIDPGTVPYDGIVSFYLQARALSAAGAIQEGASSANPSASSSKPHYSLRTLCRALQFVRDTMSAYGFTFPRALYEGLTMSFCTLLTPESAEKLHAIMRSAIFKDVPLAQLQKASPKPTAALASGTSFKLIGDAFWIATGSEPMEESQTARFIVTKTVEFRLKQLSRAMLTGKYPILLQGPTSAGKTSLVEYLALKTGHKFVRINNHEHTDLSEYMGAYVTDAKTGKLVFQEGVLVEAVRKGHWIVLDELNLAPSEVLEALNRLLDDNRELFLPETQESIRPHPHFMLFATQNPAGGVYAGRKVLSKAFRNRFITLHTDDLPDAEVEEILHLRCKLPPSFCAAMMATMKALATRREKANVFAGKRSFMTPRDLFRWGERCPVSYQQLAEDGFMLLGERLRTDEAKQIVKDVLEQHCRPPKADIKGKTKVVVDERQRLVRIDEQQLYSQEAVEKIIAQLKELMAPGQTTSAAASAALLDPTSAANAANKEAQAIGKIAWTYNMRRLFVQVGRCLLFQEPVLLVGETGCGKTTVCQLFSLVLGQHLRVINCHQHTESSDFLGGLRPVRAKEKTLVELRAAIQNWFVQYQQAQTLLAAAEQPKPADGASAAAASSEMTDDEKLAAPAPGAISFALAPVSAEILALLASLDSPAGSTSLTELMAAYRSFADPLASLDRQLASARRKHEAALADSKAIAAQSQEPPAKKSKKQLKAAAAAAASGDADMNDAPAADPAVPAPPSNPVPAALWSSLLALHTSILALHTRFQSLFEWLDGALVQAMRSAELVLIDEISLAEDAVLERLNSVLEPSRTLFLAEKGGSDAEVIRAAANFRLFATMNPGGDFGKKELSPALRNRFTEVWVPPFSDKQDLMHIIQERMAVKALHPYAESILEFVQWFNRNTKGAQQQQAAIQAAASAAPSSASAVAAVVPAAKPAPAIVGSKRYLSLRDVLSWVQFMNACLARAAAMPAAASMSPLHAYLHGSCLTVLDGLGIGSTDSDSSIQHLKTLCVDRLIAVLPEFDRTALVAAPEQAAQMQRALLAPSSAGDVIVSTASHFGIQPFLIPRGPLPQAKELSYALGASTTQTNLMRVLRAMTLPKAVLLEGPPGVGKTSLLTTLAAASGHTIVRINLSEQTDMMDLLGMDLPVAGGSGGDFRWCDGIFLQALKAGHWVLLDELNLASQSVLEGLNAVLDHRAQVFIPELDATFDCPPTFRIFACQNPMSQGGGRKGLPASFLNRFTKVYLHSLTTADLFFITRTLNPRFPAWVLHRMIDFNSRVHHETMVTRKIGRKGFPWEFNLRDVFKLCELMRREQETPAAIASAQKAAGEGDIPVPNPATYVDLVYLQRMRTTEDRVKVAAIYSEIFGAALSAEDASADASLLAEVSKLQIEEYPTFRLTSSYVQVGRAFLPRRTDISAAKPTMQDQPLLVLKQLLRPLQHLTTCMQFGFPAILLGEAATGKTSLVRLLAQLTHTPLHEILMTSGIDSSELLGCFEQVDLTRHKKMVLNKVAQLVDIVVAKFMCAAGVANAPQADDTSSAMQDEGAQASKPNAAAATSSNKATKRGRDGKLTPTAAGSAAPSASAQSLSADATMQQVSQIMHTWSMLDASSTRQTSSSSSMLAQADAKESAQTLSTAAFSSEQYALLQSLLTSLQKLQPVIEAAPISFTVPSHLSPASLLKQSAHIQDLSHASGGKVIGNFEWLDGSLISALELGEWILLDNVNFTNPTVLDRLNPLLESDGVLLVNECGLVEGKARIIKPHPNFRMILAMDQRYGEISRAMRNRCVEICLVQPIGAAPSVPQTKQVAVSSSAPGANAIASNTAVSPSTHDLLSIVNSLGIHGLSLPEFMVSVHTALTRLGASGPAHAGPSAASLRALTVRNLKHWSLLLTQQVQAGAQNDDGPVAASAGLFASLGVTFRHAYNLSSNPVAGTADIFADQLSRMFEQQYRKIVLQQGDDALGQLSASSMLAPTLWPVDSHGLWSHPSPARRALSIQGSVLKYLSLLALGQVISARDQHLLQLFRSLASERAGQAGGSLAFLPDQVWQFVFGLTQTPPVNVKNDADTIAVSTVGAAALSPADRQLLLPASAVTPSFALSAHPLHPHPTSLQLFHLSILAFIDYSNLHDHRERAEWLQRELLDGILFEQSADAATAAGVASSSIGTAATNVIVGRLRTEVQLAVRTLTSLYAHPIVLSYWRDMESVIVACGFDARALAPSINPHVDPTFLQLLHIHARGHTRAQLDQLVSRWDNVHLLVQSTYQSLYETHVYSGVALALSNPSQLSLLELSYACYTNLIHAARLNSLVSGFNHGAGIGGGLSAELVLQIYPFWAAMQALENNLLEHGFQLAAPASAVAFHAALASFVHDKNFFWRTIFDTKGLLASNVAKGAAAAASASTVGSGQAVNSMLDQIHVRWKGLSKRIRSVVALVPGLEASLKPNPHAPAAASSSSVSAGSLQSSYIHFHSFFTKLQSTLQGTTHSSTSLVGVKNTLWKRGGHPLLPRDQKLQVIEMQLQSIEAQIMYKPGVSSQSESSTGAPINRGTQPFFIVDQHFKDILIEAYVNLKFLYLQGGGAQEDQRTAQDQKELLAALSTVPAALQSKLRACVAADQQQLDSMRFRVQIVGEGEESLEDLGFETPAAKKEEPVDGDQAMLDDGHQEAPEDDGRPSAQFLSVSADASATTSSRFSDQSSHKKSYIMPLLLPIFDLAYLDHAKTVVAHVEYAGFCMHQIKAIVQQNGSNKTKSATVDGQAAMVLHTLALSLVSSLSSLLSFLPSLLSFYTAKTSAISGLLDLHALKLVEMIGSSAREELQIGLAGVDSSSFAEPSSAASFVSRFSTPKLAELFSHMPSLIQEVKYHHANFLARFLATNSSSLRAQSHSQGPLDSAVLLTPVKSLLVLELISQSLNISLIHRHAKRIQLQMLGEHLARDLIRAPRVSKRDRTQTGLVLINAAARSSFARTAHATLLECVALLTSFHALLVCFVEFFTAPADYQLVLRFVSSLIRGLLEQAAGSASAAALPAALPSDVQKALSKVQDPRLNSLLQSLVFPFFNTLLAHLASLQSPAAGAVAPEASVWALGHASLHLSLLQFNLLLPVSPVDSNQKFLVLLRDETYFATANRMQLERAQWAESLQTGNASSHAIHKLQSSARAYQSSIATLNRQVTYRRHDADRTKPFHSLFHEFHRFATTFLDLNKLRAQFLQPLTAGVQLSSDSAHRLEEELDSFQSNSSEFIVRMQQSFSEYPDFLVPLLTALYGVKYGMSTMHHAFIERREREATKDDAGKQRAVYQTVRALVSFPFGAVTEEAATQITTAASSGPDAPTAPGLIPPLHVLTLPPVLAEIDSVCRAAVSVIKEQSAIRRAEARAAAEADAHRGDVDQETVANQLMEAGQLRANTAQFYTIRLGVLSVVLSRILLFSRVSGRLTPALLQILDQLFRSFILLYKANLERQALKEAAEASLYKYKEKKVDVLTEEEADKLALQKLFPDYSADFADIIGESGAPNMDDAVEESQRRTREHAERKEREALDKADAEDEFGIITLQPEHLTTIYNAFTAIFSIQKASVSTAAVTAAPTFTEQEAHAYSNAYTSSYEIGATLLHALNMQGKLATSTIIPSPHAFEAELKPGHLFLLCQSLHKLHLSGGATGVRDEVSAIMESFLTEEETTDEEFRQRAVALHHGADSTVMQVNTSELDEAFKIDGKTGTKTGTVAGMPSQAAAAGARAATKIDWSKFPDIYHESNVEEYRKLERPLTLLMLRLRQLLNQFAHHPILMQLLQLAHRVLNLSSSTPLMKLLTGLELLLKKAEDWESHAARFVSIKKELLELGILVARWRKMELYTWPKALASRESVFHSAALKGWFQLYGLIHTDDEGIANFFPKDDASAPAPAAGQATEDAFLQRLYEALDEFLQFSNLGELKTRMSILLGFYQQMNLEIVEGFGGSRTTARGEVGEEHRTQRMSLPLRIRISHLLLNLYQYYEQFEVLASDLVHHKKAPIEKSLREQVRLAKWDLSNFWSLKESSEKSHRKLQKFSKEYEEILQQKFAAVIAKEEARDTKDGDDSVAFGRAGAEVAEARQQLERLQKHLAKQKEKLARKVEKAKAAAIAAGQEFQEDPQPAEADANADEDALPSLAQSLTIVLPDTEHYLGNEAQWASWFIQQSGEDVSMEVEAIAANRSVPSVASYQSRLPAFYSKMRRMCTKGILSAAYTAARQENLMELESFSIHVISRVHKLTLPDAKFSYKKKAFGDVTKALRQMGLTHHMSALKVAGAPATTLAVSVDLNKSSAEAFQEQTASIPTLFMQAPLTAVFLKSSAQLPLSQTEGYEFLRSLAKKCESYLYRVWGSVRKMRSRAAQAHKDLNAAESQRAKGMIEHLFFLICNQRQQVSQAAVNYHTTRKWMEWIKELDVEDAQQSQDVAAASASSVSAFPSWTSRFWSHKHLLDSLFSGAKYVQLLYTRMSENMLSNDNSTVLKTQLDEALAKVRTVLTALSAAKIEVDQKIAKLFPNQQLAQSRINEATARLTEGATAAESVLELNDQPNAAFLLANIERVLSVVTVQEPASSAVVPMADGAAVAATAVSDEEEGAIIELPFLSTTSTFNELVVGLIRSKYEIRSQARAALVASASSPSSAAPSSSPAADSVVELSRDFTASYHSLVDALRLSVQSSVEHVKTQTDLAARRARISSGEEQEGTGKDALPAEKTLLDEMIIADAAVSTLRLQQTNDKLHELTATLNRLKRCRASDPSVDAAYRSYRLALHNLVPLLDQVLLLSERLMAVSMNLHRTSLKLSHILLSVLNKILSRGFCRRPDEPDDEGGEGPTEEKEGTGMGEGEGEKDVSNQITDEEQLLGNKDPLDDEKEKNPEAPPDEKPKPDTDEGVEMEGGFEGDMHDVPSDDEQEKDPNKKDDEDQKEELDKEMGDLGDKQDVVDEKLWDESDDDSQEDDETKQKKKQEEKYERDAPIEGANPDEDELAAKDEQDAGSNEKDKPPQKDDDKDPKLPEEDKPEPKPAEDDGQKPEDEDADEEEQPDESGMVNEDRPDKYEDKHDVDAMNNLPDDLALDDEEKDEKEKGEDDEKDGEEEGKDEEDEAMPDDAGKLDGEEKMDLDDEGEKGDGDDGEDLDKDKENNEEDPDKPEEAPEAEEAQNTVEADQGDQPEQDEDKPEDEAQEPDAERPDQHAAPDQKDTNQGAHRVAGGEQGRSGAEEEKDLEAPEKEKKAAPAPEEQQSSEQKAEDQNLDQANSNDAAEGTESEWQPQSAQSHSANQPESQDKSKKKKPQPKQKPNPFKSLGDAAKKWQERLKILDDSQKPDEDTTQLENDDDDDEQGEDGEETIEGTVENVGKKEKADAQMLGPVEQKLDSKDLPTMQAQPEVEEPKPEEEKDEPIHEQPDPDTDTTKPQDKEEEGAAKKESRKRGGAQQLQPSRMQDLEDEDEEDPMDDVAKEDQPDFDPFAAEEKEKEEEQLVSAIGSMDDMAAALANPAADINDPAHAEYLQALRDDLDASLVAWDSCSSSDRNARAHALWHKFTDLTSDLSSALTESLRMILEPQLATKLRGDYKTGKRISIKKIIPYIASSFRKDKIWLKRTKPNKRQYQVLLAIDDSDSMRKHGGGRLALEAMTVLTKALSALEVGEMAVASFGSQVQLLHPFNRPFTDESGAYTLGHFQFSQQDTNWPDLLERTIGILDEAKATGAGASLGAEHHQLVFVISDARVNRDREVVARWIREALSKNQLLILIIVDPEGAIETTVSASFVGGKLKRTPYLDEFPFPYYILLRDIASLPEIVADALRQWFELVRQA